MSILRRRLLVERNLPVIGCIAALADGQQAGDCLLSCTDANGPEFISPGQRVGCHKEVSSFLFEISEGIITHLPIHFQPPILRKLAYHFAPPGYIRRNFLYKCTICRFSMFSSRRTVSNLPENFFKYFIAAFRCISVCFIFILCVLIVFRKSRSFLSFRHSSNSAHRKRPAVPTLASLS